MKKLMTFLLVLSLCLSFASCGTKDNNDQNTGNGTNGNNNSAYDDNVNDRNNNNTGNNNMGGNATNDNNLGNDDTQKPVRLKRDIDTVAKHLNLRDGTDTLYNTIGAKAGKEYNNGRVELYHFDKDSAEYESIRKGKGAIKAAAYNDGFVLLFTDKTDEAMVREFKRIEFK